MKLRVQRILGTALRVLRIAVHRPPEGFAASHVEQQRVGAGPDSANAEQNHRITHVLACLKAPGAFLGEAPALSVDQDVIRRCRTDGHNSRVCHVRQGLMQPPLQLPPLLLKRDGLHGREGAPQRPVGGASPDASRSGVPQEVDVQVLVMRRADIAGPRASLLVLDALVKGAVQVVLLRAALSLDGLE